MGTKSRIIFFDIELIIYSVVLEIVLQGKWDYLVVQFFYAKSRISPFKIISNYSMNIDEIMV